MLRCAIHLVMPSPRPRAHPIFLPKRTGQADEQEQLLLLQEAVRQSRDTGATSGLLGSGTDALQILQALTSADARRSDSAAAAVAAAAAAAVAAAETEDRDSDEDDDDEDEEDEEGEEREGLAGAEMSGEVQHIMARFKARAEAKAAAEEETETAAAGTEVDASPNEGGSSGDGGGSGGEAAASGDSVAAEGAPVQPDGHGAGDRGDDNRRESEEDDDNEYLMVRSGGDESKDEGDVVEEKGGEGAEGVVSDGKPAGKVCRVSLSSCACLSPPF